MHEREAVAYDRAGATHERAARLQDTHARHVEEAEVRRAAREDAEDDPSAQAG
jgi:hypothetical protein